MPGNLIGTKLSRLIRERAYLAGEIPILDGEISALRTSLKEARARHKKANDRIQELDRLLTDLSAIDPTKIRAIRSMPRREGDKHGDFRREMIRVLKAANGPIWSSDLARHMAEAFNLPMETSKDRQRLQYLVRRPLNLFKKKGAVERLPTGSTRSEGLWKWCGD